MDGELLRAEAELIQIQFWEDYGIRLTFLVTKYMTGNKTEVRIVIFTRCTIFYVNNLKYLLNFLGILNNKNNS